MNKQHLKNIIVLVVFTMIFSLFPINHSKAEGIDSEGVVIEIEDILVSELAKENISVNSLEISTESLTLETSLDNANGDTTEITVEVEPGENYL